MLTYLQHGDLHFKFVYSKLPRPHILNNAFIFFFFNLNCEFMSVLNINNFRLTSRHGQIEEIIVSMSINALLMAISTYWIQMKRPLEAKYLLINIYTDVGGKLFHFVYDFLRAYLFTPSQ